MYTRLRRWFDWQKALIVVKPDTLIGWHRKGFRLEVKILPAWSSSGARQRSKAR
jgi:hypothetical protein